MKSVMSHNFATLPGPQVPRSVFNRSHGHKTVLNAGYLVPIYVDEALPGDTFNMNASVMGRLNTPVVPIMDNMYLDTFYFAVPNRLLWTNWEAFIAGGNFTVPIVDFAGVQAVENDIYDYMGIPPGVSDIEFSALPFRAYNMIFDEWFRAQDLVGEVGFDVDNGPDSLLDFELLKRGKRHDYFTSSLPYPQKTAAAVSLPLGDSAPVIGDGFGMRIDNGTEEMYLTNDVSGNMYARVRGGMLNVGDSIGGTVPTVNGAVIGLDQDIGDSGLIADLSSATAATINDLREAFQIQKMLERDARGGTRYVELIRSHFGVVSPDFRLQRPEYLGGSSQRITISSVPQTSETSVTSAQGNLAAYGVVSDNSCRWNKSFTEHCWIIGLACLRADLTYQQGMARMFSRQTRYDFYWPALAHIGEQEVLTKEIYLQGNADDDIVFGYQERYAEYRYNPSRISGTMRSAAATPLDMWHLSQEFAGRPVLNTAFIAEDPPMDRILAVADEPHLKFDSYFDLRCTRPMPTYSVPGLIDHF